MDGADIRYTLDGSEPKENSLLYSDPLIFDKDILVKARTVMKSGKSSVTISINLDKQEIP
jgi:predicted RNA binding protein with dsRBD fold (UPF0201 family)